MYHLFEPGDLPDHDLELCAVGAALLQVLMNYPGKTSYCNERGLDIVGDRG